jgi:hypothetical protein
MNTYIDFRAVVEESLAAYPTSSSYFLLDHGALPGLHRQLLRSSVEWVSLFEHSKEANALAVAPILILAGHDRHLRMPRSLLRWIEEHGIYTSSVIMLSSRLDIQCMKNRLIRRLDVRLSEEMEVMLRFFDPRVLESLIITLSTDQANTFFSPAEEWRYMDRTGRLNAIISNFSDEENLFTPLVLSQQQEFALLQASEKDQVLDLLRSNVPSLMAALPLAEQHAFVSRRIIEAREGQLNSIWKFALYAAVALLKGEEITENSLWAQFMDKLKQDNCDFSEIFS